MLKDIFFDKYNLVKKLWSIQYLTIFLFIFEEKLWSIRFLARCIGLRRGDWGMSFKTFCLISLWACNALYARRCCDSLSTLKLFSCCWLGVFLFLVWRAVFNENHTSLDLSLYSVVGCPSVLAILFSMNQLFFSYCFQRKSYLCARYYVRFLGFSFWNLVHVYVFWAFLFDFTCDFDSDSRGRSSHHYWYFTKTFLFVTISIVLLGITCVG